MLTIFLRKIPMDNGRFSVEALKSPDGPRVAYWSWWQRDRPDRRYKSIMLNCYRWRIEWVNA